MANQYLADLFGLNGKTAVLTGATRGIGQSLALALASAGADLVLLQRDTAVRSTADQVEALGRKCYLVECDLGNREQVRGVTDKITKEMGLNIDILVNCGGIQRRTPAENFSSQDWDDVLEVQLQTVWTLCQSIGRHMLESRGGIAGQEPPANTVNPRGNGKIINIASLVSYQGGLTVPAYTASKHAVLGLTKALSNEWSSKGINVNAISPGYINTDMNEALIANPVRSRQIMERIPAGRWGAPKDFEGAVIYLASAASDYVCGEAVLVDGGWMGR